MKTSLESGFDDPARLAQISRLMDQGYAVYFGGLDADGEITNTETPGTYYALVIPLDTHQEQIHSLNNIREAAHSLAQAQREIYWIEEDPFDPLRRFAGGMVLSDPNLRTGKTAREALLKATKTSEKPEPTTPFMRLFKPARLRQSRTHPHK